MFAGTAHAWALQQLQELGGSFELAEALTDEQEWALLHRMARRLGIVQLLADSDGKPGERVAAGPAVDAFLRSAEVVHNEHLDRGELGARAPAFTAVLDRYEWLLERMRLLPFRLMIARAVDELAPGGRLRARLDGAVTHVLVDEFQDFNPAQAELLRRLAELGAAVTAVGDDDQAIYQWRGGDVSLFTSFAARTPDARMVRLADNHRCRPEIVRFAAQLVATLPDRLDKALASSRDPSQSGTVEVAVARTAEEEAQLVANRIASLLQAGHEPGDVAVLYRSVRSSARPVVEELRRRGIPVQVAGKTSLLARPEMALVARLFVWWAGGTWYPNPDFTAEVVTRASLLAEIRDVTGMDDRQAEQALKQLDDLGRAVQREGVRDSVELFNDILDLLGLPGTHGDVARRELGLGRTSELLTAFHHAVRRAAPAELHQQLSPDQADEADEDRLLAADDAEARRKQVLGATRGEVYLIRLRAFLEQFAGRAAEETPDLAGETTDAVQVMTVHQAKGLEFPVVFVPSLVDSRFPSSLTGRAQQWYVPDDLFDRERYEGREEDEARLLYVALTRAKELLAVSWFNEHRASRAKPSRFLTRNLRTAFDEAVTRGVATPVVVGGGEGEDPLELDFSSLVTYENCGYRWWLRHGCGFQPPVAPELGFGKLLHHVVAKLARRATAGRAPSSEDVDAILDDGFYLPFAGPIPAQQLRESIRTRAKAYLREFGASSPGLCSPRPGSRCRWPTLACHRPHAGS